VAYNKAAISKIN